MDMRLDSVNLKSIRFMLLFVSPLRLGLCLAVLEAEVEEEEEEGNAGSNILLPSLSGGLDLLPLFVFTGLLAAGVVVVVIVEDESLATNLRLFRGAFAVALAFFAVLVLLALLEVRSGVFAVVGVLLLLLLLARGLRLVNLVAV